MLNKNVIGRSVETEKKIIIKRIEMTVGSWHVLANTKNEIAFVDHHLPASVDRTPRYLKEVTCLMRLTDWCSHQRFNYRPSLCLEEAFCKADILIV